MKKNDIHGRQRGPADRQAEAEHLYTLPVEGEMVQDILDMLKEAQRRNEELTNMILDTSKRTKPKDKPVKSARPRLEDPVRKDKPDEVCAPELDNVFFDVSKDNEVECNFDELSDDESVSKAGIADDSIKKLRDLVKKGGK